MYFHRFPAFFVLARIISDNCTIFLFFFIFGTLTDELLFFCFLIESQLPLRVMVIRFEDADLDRKSGHDPCS